MLSIFFTIVSLSFYLSNTTFSNTISAIKWTGNDIGTQRWVTDKTVTEMDSSEGVSDYSRLQLVF